MTSLLRRCERVARQSACTQDVSAFILAGYCGNNDLSWIVVSVASYCRKCISLSLPLSLSLSLSLSHTHTHTHARTHTNELLLCVTLVVHATGSRAKYCQKYFRSDQLSSKYKDDRSSEDIKTYGQHIVALIGCDVRGSLGLPVKPEKQNNDESLQLQIAPPMCDTLI